MHLYGYVKMLRIISLMHIIKYPKILDLTEQD